MEAWYYSRMNKWQKSVYQAMKQGFEACASVIPVQRLEGEELANIFFHLRLDCPQLFYVDTYKYRFASGADTVELLPVYLFDKKKVAAHRQAVQARLKRLCDPLKGKSEEEKLLTIHDFLCENVRYDKLKKPYSHEIIGPLTQGVGVCEGIAKSVKAMCDELGLWCVIAISEANPAAGIRYRHAWNVIKLGGKYYHLDATFDLSLSGEGVIRRDYVFLSDKQLFRDHQPIIWPMPECPDGDAFWYRRQKLSFTKLEDVEKRARQHAKKAKPFTFHWRGGYLTREVLQQLLVLLDACATEKGRHASVAVNLPQAVLCVSFKEAPAAALEEQTANEGELYEE